MPAAQHHWPRLFLRLADLFSIEASLVLFLVSGRYKKLPEMQGFPVDFTVFFFAATACLIAWAVTSGRLKLRSANLPVLLMVLFIAFVVVSLFWSSLQPFNIDKAWRFVVLTSTSFFAAYLIAQDPHRRDRFLRLLAWFSFGLVLYYFYYRLVLGIDVAPVTGKPGLAAAGDNYQEYGEHAAILFIVFLALAVYSSSKQLCGAVIGSGAALYALATIGGRGALAFAILAIPLLGVGLTLRAHRLLGRLVRFVILLSLLATCGGIGLLATSGTRANQDSSQFRTLNRYQMDLSNEDTTSMDERTQGRALAFGQWLRKPIFGWGIGEFRVEDNYLKYPHNTPLEILMEMGIVGAFIFFSVVALAVAACLHIARNTSTGWGATVVALLFLTQLASHLTFMGDLGDDRIFLAFMGLVIGSRIGRGTPTVVQEGRVNREDERRRCAV